MTEQERLVALISEFHEKWKHGDGDRRKGLADYLLLNGYRKQSEDTAEVVRCKDCERWKRNAGRVDSPNGHCFWSDIDTNGFDFCSYGEKRS